MWARKKPQISPSACAVRWKHKPPHKNRLIRMTASIDIACKQANETAETALHRADKAMYRAKFNGRNRVEIATDEDATVLIASA